MQFGGAVPAYGSSVGGSAILEMVSAAEELGFASVWWPDHIAVPHYAAAANLQPPFLEPLAACAWGLSVTSRIWFGTDVLVAPYRHPLSVAATAATMTTLAGSRLVLGVGVGYLRGEFDALGADYERRAATTESWLETFRKPPSGYSVIAPPTPIPLWVGGNSPKALRRAALLGDGWHPLWLPASEYRRARDEIEAMRQEAGRAEQPFTFSFSAGMTRFADKPSDGWPAPAQRAPRGSEFRYAPAPWIAPDGRPRLTGSPDDLTADLQQLQQVGVDHVTLRFGTPEVAPMVRFAQEVLPAFAR